MFYKIVRCIKDILFVACVSYAMVIVNDIDTKEYANITDVSGVIILLFAAWSVWRDTKS